MYFIKKCSEKGCKRTGTVALTPDAKFCNIHSKEEISTVVNAENKDLVERDANGARIEDPENQDE
jgi:hypothetical protein